MGSFVKTFIQIGACTNCSCLRLSRSRNALMVLDLCCLAMAKEAIVGRTGKIVEHWGRPSIGARTVGELNQSRQVLSQSFVGPYHARRDLSRSFSRGTEFNR
jgi:hypothetical protein